jgi:hypothetical protein
LNEQPTARCAPSPADWDRKGVFTQLRRVGRQATNPTGSIKQCMGV